MEFILAVLVVGVLVFVGFKVTHKPSMSMAANVTETVPVKLFSRPVTPDQVVRGLRVNFTFAGRKCGGWVKKVRGSRVTVATVMRGHVHMVHRKTHQLTTV